MTQSEFEREKKRATRDLQEMLLELNRGGVINTMVVPDGIFGDETTAAVIEFQNLNSLEPNGVVDRETWDRISQQHKIARELRVRALSLQFFPEEKIELKLGDNDDAVYVLKIIFKSLANDFSEFSYSEIDDYFDSITEDNVKAFQRLGGFEEHGRVDKPTWNRLVNYYNLYEN